MSTVTCPHCHSDVSFGAKVCKGCQAEIEYGCPPILFVILIIICAVIGYKVSDMTFTILGWIAGGGLFFAGVWKMNDVFKERVSFKRIYHTK